MQAIWPRELYTPKKQERAWELANGGTIEFRSAEDTGGLVGEGLRWLIVDEAARVPELTWQSELEPTLATHEAPALLISTPRGKNWYYQAWLKGQGEQRQGYQSWQQASNTSPFFKQTEYDRLRQELPEAIFAQEVLAEFVEGAGSVFRNIEACLAGQLQQAPVESGTYVMGVDLAKHEDWTVITVLDADTGQVVAWQRFQHLDWHIQREMIRTLYTTWGRPFTLVDSTGVGDPVVEELKREGMDCEGFGFTAASKSELVTSLMLAFEQEAIHIPPSCDVLRSELGAYTYEMTPRGNVQYGAPAGFHDDAVMSLGLAWLARDRSVNTGVWWA